MAPSGQNDVFRYDFGPGSVRVIWAVDAREIVGRLRARQSNAAAQELADRMEAHYNVQAELRFAEADITVLQITLRYLPEHDSLQTEGAQEFRREVLALVLGARTTHASDFGDTRSPSRATRQLLLLGSLGRTRGSRPG